MALQPWGMSRTGLLHPHQPLCSILMAFLSFLLAFPKAMGWLLETPEPLRAELTFENDQFRNFPRRFPSRPPSYCNCSSELSSSNSVNLREIRLCFCCHF